MRSLASCMAVAVLCLAGAAPAATVEGRLGATDASAAPAVIYLEGGTVFPPAGGARAVMDQKNLTFTPPVLPVVRGTTVEFTNSDDVQHNVFSPSTSAGKFNLGTYGPGGTRTVTLDEAGDVRVLCNIHMEMEGHVLVLDTPYFATAGSDGHYTIHDVPAGVYTLKIWRGRWLPFARALEVPAQGTLSVDIERPQ